MRAIALVALVPLLLSGVADAKKKKKKKKKAKKPAIEVRYTLELLPDVEGEGMDVNASGDVVGYYHGADGKWVAFVWKDGERTDLGTLGADFGTLPREITDDGVIVGESNNRAFAYSDQLVALSDRFGSRVHGVDARGNYAVGEAYDKQSRSVCVMWTSQGEVELPGLPGGCIAYDVAGDGTVLGSYWDGSTTSAFLWKDATSTIIADLGSGSGAWPNALSEGGVAVGTGSRASGGTYAWVYQGGALTELPSPGAYQAQANDVNEAGLVVGMIDLDGDYRAVIWDSGQLIDLNKVVALDKGVKLTTAYGVGDGGHITGYAYVKNKSRAFRLTPVQSSK
jgi:probable HAF family extracellular repeat protein